MPHRDLLVDDVVAMELLTVTETDLPPAEFVAAQGEVFRVFDRATQDSGNVSYGVRAGPDRYFVKTAGSRDDARPVLPHNERVALLRTAVRIANYVRDPAMPTLHNVVESPAGPLLVYEWLDGQLIGVPRDERADPRSTYARFRGLPLAERARALDIVFRLHERLAAAGWIASDFYDGCMVYDFTTRQMRVIDLDNYRQGRFTNEMGRMFGSTRFMAPEELERGATIDERTTVFTMGRTVEQFLTVDGAIPGAAMELASRACELEPRRRFETMHAFYESWSKVMAGLVTQQDESSC